jgi:cytochrome c oxidase subunit 3
MSSDHDSHGHGSPWIQHHYDDGKHQFESGKLGIWLFLVTEILFFSGLFVAYILYRAQHPEIYEYAHKWLDVKWGAINTGVLIFSSFTAAYAVRAAQLRQQKALMLCLATTILCAFGFLGIKFVEYKAKIDHGTLWGCRFLPHADPHGRPLRVINPDKFPEDKTFVLNPGKGATEPWLPRPGAYLDPCPNDKRDGHRETEYPPEHFTGETPPPNTGMFFSVYFALTGLHGIHVTAGVLVFIWLLVRAGKRHFTPEYFGPVDYGALYWHLVDLIWIYLFPLLYLIS